MATQNSSKTIEKPAPDFHELIMIDPDIDPQRGIINQFIVTLTNPEVTFKIVKVENKFWECRDLPDGVDPDMVQWIGDEIDGYYR